MPHISVVVLASSNSFVRVSCSSVSVNDVEKLQCHVYLRIDINGSDKL